MKTINGIEYPGELLELLQEGNAVRINMAMPVRNEVHHIIKVVDEDYVVVKFWSRYKQRWIYEVNWLYKYLLDYNGENMELVKKCLPK